MSKYIKKDKSKICKAICKTGRRCTNAASFGDYCVMHFIKVLEKKNKEKEKKK